VADFSSILAFTADAPGQGRPPSLAAVVWLGSTFLFLLGLVDDFIHIRPYTKLVGQIIAASMVVFLGFRLHWFSSMTLDATFTFIWIIGLTNAFNLLDNMDGLCAGVGLVAALFLGRLFFGGAPEAMMISLILAGALAAFLIYNYNPASIFMGDSGSLTIGFTLAVVALYFAEVRAANPISAVAIPVMVLLVPIMDTSLVTLIRLLSGRKASMGGRDHTSHRLVLMGFSERTAVLFLYGIGAVSGVAALFVSVNDTLTSPAVIIPLTLSALLMGIYLSQIRVYPEKEFSRLRGRTFTPILIELTYKRQLTLVMLDFCLIAFAYYLSYRLRFDSREFVIYFRVFLQSLPAVIACKFVAFFAMGVYRGIWRYLSTDDISVCMKAATLGSLLSVVAVTYIFRFANFSTGIVVIDWLLSLGFILGARGSFRLFLGAMNRNTLSGDRVLICGAGRGGEILLRELRNNKNLKMNPV
ncbi:MAG: glycosyl transferase, partial [Desulfobacterales bacterium]|nr:glycosyl transferase [Desulfobacterales bacterium]